MKKIGIFMADGCEEIEGLAVVDILRRGEVEVTMLSISDKKEVTGSHGIVFQADMLSGAADYDAMDGIVLPGGMPGTLRLLESETVNRVIRRFAEEEKLVCAICAAPSVLGAAGLLEGKRAACHPGYEDKLTGASICFDPVVVHGNFITSRGMGTAMEFGIAILEQLADRETVDKVVKGLVYKKTVSHHRA